MNSFWKSMTPRKLICNLSSGASSLGRMHLMMPSITIFGSGNSTITPSSALMSVGVPHPILAMRPMTKPPSLIGKICLMSLMMRWMLPTTSSGKSMLRMAPVRSPTRIGSTSMPRLMPSIPPTPSKVNPKPN